MKAVIVNPETVLGKIKPMNAVNNGPFHKEGAQARSSLKDYAALEIPYARNHDASFSANYGGEHTVDVHAIFPDFSKDPYSPESYDFPVTDNYLQTIEKAGTKVFYRLGSKIEHGVKKYGTLPPPDFKKWAVICEHIIRHYTEGWANGFHMDIAYWEIWNEPELDKDDSPSKRCWGGTAEEFFEFYIIAAKHLKACFPHLKIGGPSVSNPFREPWIETFLKKVKEANAPLDFFSWHLYGRDPEYFSDSVILMRQKLDAQGFYDTESILNEWNYVRGWSGDFLTYSIETIIGMKGAAFTAAVMSVCQSVPLDMLMYYDFRLCSFNGAFDSYTLRPRKTYYAFHMFKKLYNAGTQIEVLSEVDKVYTLGAKGEDGIYTLITHYSDDMQEFEVKLPKGCHEVFLLDETHNEESILKTEDNTINLILRPNAVVLIESR